jgi:tRNA-splicing ligase RtcB
MRQITTTDEGLLPRRHGKVMNWASILEDETREQAEVASTMPFIHPHLALMPDAHLGKGATVGSVIPTHGAIMPAAVGVDIGCGMIANRTNITLDEIEGLDRKALREGIEQVIPLSPGKYNEGYYNEHTEERIRELDRKSVKADFDPAKDARNWDLQLGSLGGGNHFIEVSADTEGYLWLFLHSGSRGVGNKIAQRHIKVAQEQCEKRFITLPHRDLAYLVEGEPEFWAYIKQLRWAQEFARLNREEMMERVEDVFEEWIRAAWGEGPEGDVKITQSVNCHHNYTERERHYGKEVWLSRKGAISAKAGEWGLIPGSMGTRSYVVQRLGNPLALNSAPHGAGREYSRSKARKTFTLDDLKDRMGDIEYRVTDAFVDEIPDAYKDIDVVMEDAADLVEIRYELAQIVNVKGE